MTSDMTNEPLDRPLEEEGVPAEEDLQSADVEEKLDEDPDEVPNAPNRDPHEKGPANVQEIREQRGDDTTGSSDPSDL